MRREIGWRAWYDHSRKYDSATTKWEDLPDDGMQVLVVYYEDDNRMMFGPSPDQRSGVDHYFQVPGPDGEMIYGSNSDTDTEILARYPGAIIKRGRWTTYEEFSRLQEEAGTEKEAP